MVPACGDAAAGPRLSAADVWARPSGYEANSQWHRWVLSIRSIHSNRLIPNFTVTVMCSLKQKNKSRDRKPEDNEEPGKQCAPARHQVGFAFPLDEAVAHATHPAFQPKDSGIQLLGLRRFHLSDTF